MSQDVALISDMVRDAERSTPDDVALTFEGASWTWQQLAERVRRNANAQRGAGLAPGDRVAFLDKNHAACLETTLACALGGTVNAVVNFRLTPAELTYVINDSAARVLFVGHELAETVETIRGDLTSVQQVIVVGGPDDQYEPLLASADVADTGHTAQPDDCFLQLYTSGTTGYPKGAMLTHRSMLAHSATAVDGFGFTPESVNLVAMPLFHVGGTSWALAGMTQGARTVLVREVVPDKVLAQIAEEKATHAFFVPAVFGFFLQVPGVADYDYSSLRCLGYGGSPMPTALLRRVLEVFPVDLYQVYGMTEASGVFCILGPDEHRDSAHPERLISSGKPVTGVEMRVVDPSTREPLGDDEIGEFEMRGAQVMAGYWRQPEATASTIVDGWLRTGDAGRRDSAGYFYVEDRIKEMIISGGENIYPAEIERVLSEYPDVAEVAVIGVPDEKWGESVKAIVAAKQDADLDTDKLLDYARENLAGYKQPKSIDVMDALPRNATGKLLKRTLREPYWVDRERNI